MADDTDTLTTDDLRRPYAATDKGDQTAQMLSSTYDSPQEAHAAGVDPRYAAGVFREAGMHDLADHYDAYAGPPAPATTASPATVPAWDAIASHPEFQKLSSDAKQAVVDQYAAKLRDFALTLPGAPDSAALDDHFSQWSQVTKDRLVNPLTPDQAAAVQTDVGAGPGRASRAPEGSPEAAILAQPSGVTDAQGRPVTYTPEQAHALVQPAVEPSQPTVSEQVQGVFGGGWEHLFTPALESTPTVAQPTDSDVTKLGVAMHNAVSGFVSGFTSPAMVATLGVGALPGAGRAVAGGFLADMVRQLPQMQERWDQVRKTPFGSPERYGFALEVVTQNLFGLGLAHGIAAPHEIAGSLGKAPDEVVQAAAADLTTQKGPLGDAVKAELEKRNLAPIPADQLGKALGQRDQDIKTAQSVAADMPETAKVLVGKAQANYNIATKATPEQAHANELAAFHEEPAVQEAGKIESQPTEEQPNVNWTRESGQKFIDDNAEAFKERGFNIPDIVGSVGLKGTGRDLDLAVEPSHDKFDYEGLAKKLGANSSEEVFHDEEGNEHPFVQFQLPTGHVIDLFAKGDTDNLPVAPQNFKGSWETAKQPNKEVTASGTTQSEQAQEQAGKVRQGDNNPQAQTDLQRAVLSETAGPEPASPYDKYAGITEERALELDGKNSPAGYARLAIAQMKFDDLTSEEQARVVDYQRRDVEQAKQAVKDAYARGKRGIANNKALGLPNKGISGGNFDAHKDALKYQRGSEARLKDLLSRQKPTAATGNKPVSPEVASRVKFEGQNPNEYSKSSTQVTLPPESAKPLQDFSKAIPDKEIYTDPDDPTFGRESEPHITALYGITDADPHQTAKAVLDVTNGEPITAKIGKLSVFKRDKYDVLTADVDSPQLHAINTALRKSVPYENDFPDYKPHLTLAYLKPGEGAKYAGDSRFQGAPLQFSKLDFRSKDGRMFSVKVSEKGSAEAAQPAPRSDVGAVAKPETGSKQAAATKPIKITYRVPADGSKKFFVKTESGWFESKSDGTPKTKKPIDSTIKLVGALEKQAIAEGKIAPTETGARPAAPTALEKLQRAKGNLSASGREKLARLEAAEIAHTTAADLGKALQVPKGTTALRATTDKGRVSIVRAADLKGDNVLRGGGPYKKIEAGTIGRGNEFVPMKEKIKAKPLGIAGEDGTESLKPRISPEDEENISPEQYRSLRSSEELGTPESSELSPSPVEESASKEVSGITTSALKAETAMSAHQGATSQAVAEVLGGKSLSSATADQVAKGYATVNKALEKFFYKWSINDPAVKSELTQDAYDVLRDDFLANAKQTGDVFKVRTTAGKEVPYAASMRANSKLTDIAEHKDFIGRRNRLTGEIAEPVQREAILSDAEAEALGRTPTQLAAPEAREQIENKFADLHNTFEKALEDFSFEYQGASAKVTEAAARMALDKIIKEKSGVSLGFTKQGAPIKGASDLAADPDFVAQVREQVFGKAASEARRKYEDSRDYMGLRALNVSPGDALALVDGAGALKSKVAAFVKAAKPKDTWTALFDAGDNKSRLVARELGNEVLHELQRVTDKKHEAHARRALSMVVEAQGDIGKLREAYAKIQNSPHSWAFDAKAAFEYAEDHFAQLKPIADRYKAVMDGQIELENNNGIPTPRREGYVMHAQELGPSGLLFESSGGDISTGFTHERIHDTFADSIAAGVKPKTLDAIDLLESRVSRGLRQINRKAWVEAGREIIDPSTQAPLVADAIAEQSGRVHAPKGYELQNIGANQVAVHEGYAGMFDALTSTSKIRNSVVGRGVLETAGAIKHGLLLFDTFHLGRLGFYNFVLRGKATFNKALLLLDNSATELSKMHANGEIPSNVPLEGLLENKRIISGLVNSGFNLGGVQEAMFAGFVRTNRFLKNNVGAFNKWLFEKFQRGAMAQSGIIEFNRQRAMYPERSEAEISRQVAKDLNTRFGNLRSQGWIKSRTMQDLASLTFLAEQWNEGLLRSEVGAYKQLAQGVGEAATNRRFAVGALGRSAAVMVIGQFAANQIVNYITRGHPTWENEEEGLNAKISAWIPDVVGGGPGFFLNPMSMGAELQHQFLSRMEVNDNQVFKSLAQVAGYKFSPGLRAAYTAYSQKDQFGRNLTNDWDVVKQVGLALLPTPIPAKAGYRVGESFGKGSATQDFVGQIQRQAMATVGLKADQAPSPAQRVIRLAREYNRAHGVKENPEFSASDYSDLRRYLTLNDTDRAKQAYTDLLKNKKDDVIQKYFRQQPFHPFTHNKAREGQFKASLSPEQRQIYQKALQEKKDVSKRFSELRKQVRASSGTGSTSSLQ